MTSIAPAAASAAANPPDSRAKAARRLGEPEFSLAVLAPPPQLNTAIADARPPIQATPAHNERAEPAPVEAQVPGRAEAVSATAAAESRLTRRRSAEQPNQVNLAQRAAGELASPRDPLGLIPPPAAGAGSASEAVGQRGSTDAQTSAAPKDGRRAEPPAHAPTAAESPRELAPARSIEARGGATPTQMTPAQNANAAVAGQAAGHNAGPVRAVSVAPAAAPVTALSKPGGAESAGPRNATHAMAVREGLWRHLGRLGQHAPAARAGAATRAGPAPEAYAKVEAQVARGLAAALQQKEGKVTLRLAPEALGRLKIDLAISADRVTAHISTQTEQARRLLKDNVDSLRAALEARGLGVERIEVVGGPAEPAAAPPPAHAETTAGGPGGDGPWNGPSHGSHEAGPGSNGGAGGQGGSRDGPARADDRSDAAEPPAEGDVYVLRIDFLA